MKYRWFVAAFSILLFPSTMALAVEGVCVMGSDGSPCWSGGPPINVRPAPSRPTPEQLRRQRDEREEKDLSDAAEDANDKGYDAYQRGHYEDAVKYLSEALEDRPDDGSIRHNLEKAQAALNAERARNVPPRPPNYDPTIAIPIPCIALGVVGDAPCEAVGVLELTYELHKALSSERPRREVLRVFAKAFGESMVALSFPANYRMADKIELIEKMYAYEREMFSYVGERINAELIDDPAVSAELQQLAITDAAAVQKLVNDVYSEARNQADRMEETIRKTPTSSAVKFKCETACGQLIQVAKFAWRTD